MSFSDSGSWNNIDKIKTMKNNYCLETSYENLICRTFRSQITSRNVVIISAYRNMVAINDGIKYKNETSEKQFLILKQFLGKALSKFLKRNLTNSERNCISSLIQETNNAIFLQQVDIIIEKALIITGRFKEY